MNSLLLRIRLRFATS